MSEKLTRGVGEMIDRETIKRITLECGFTLREQQGNGRIDLNEYVYDFAVRIAAELAKGSEPAAWAATSEEGVVEALGFNQSKRFNTPLYTRPQPTTQPVWQPIETAPKDGREVLLRVKVRAGIPNCQLVGHYMPGGHCIDDHPSIANGWYFWDGCMFDKAAEPTHWMPIPTATEPSK